MGGGKDNNRVRCSVMHGDRLKSLKKGEIDIRMLLRLLQDLNPSQISQVVPPTSSSSQKTSSDIFQKKL